MTPDSFTLDGVKESPIDQLCTQCGFCCNGVLFGDVQLSRGDSPKVLQEHGFSLKRKGKKTLFCQPCPQWQEGLCQAYDFRPVQCRAFECRLLQRVKTGEVASSVAIKKIREARAQVQALEKLLRALGDTRPDLPLNQRCAQVMREPEDPSASAVTRRARSRLMHEFHRLGKLLEAEFV